MSDAERERAFLIAAQARRFALLAERPELLYPDEALRAERLVHDDTRSHMDVVLLAGMGELDRLCAAAVSMLNRDAPHSKPILDLLGVLPADYLLSIYFALPDERRGQCGRDGVWAYHLRRIPDGVEEAMVTLESLATVENAEEVAGLLLKPEEAEGFRRFSEALLRRSLDLPHDLTEDEEALVVAGERALADAVDGR